jgi:hypothetical protein
VKGLGVEVGTVWPLNRTECLIEIDCVEKSQILKGPKQLSFQDWSKVDALTRAVFEPQRQRVRTDDLHVLDAMNGVTHGMTSRSAQWLDLERRLAGLQEDPVLQQFLVVDLCPRLDQSLLRARKITTDALDGIEREHPCGRVVHGMEVGSMMRLTDLHEHSDDDPEKARELGHVVTLHRRRTARLANVLPLSRERRSKTSRSASCIARRSTAAAAG